LVTDSGYKQIVVLRTYGTRIFICWRMLPIFDAYGTMFYIHGLKALTTLLMDAVSNLLPLHSRILLKSKNLAEGVFTEGNHC
jgi:hypothetical protein